MEQIRDGIAVSKQELKLYRHAPRFAPAGQSTQMIVGATPESDRQILSLTQGLYDKYHLKRVFYSAYVPVSSSPLLPAPRDFQPPLLREHRLYQADWLLRVFYSAYVPVSSSPLLPAPRDFQPPLLREHRLYQADWLLRYYHFRAEELLDEASPDLDPRMDPKCTWALRHLDFFPVEVNKADYEALLRVPGVGVRSAQRILTARRVGPLDFEGAAPAGGGPQAGPVLPHLLRPGPPGPEGQRGRAAAPPGGPGAPRPGPAHAGAAVPVRPLARSRSLERKTASKGGVPMAWTQVCCQYDGSYAGFLTCVFENYVNREEPVEFRTPDDPCCSLYPLRAVVSDRARAERVYRSLDKLGREGKDLAVRGFLTCLPDRELWLWRLLRLGYARGPAFARDLTDPTVDTVRKAVLHLNSEAHKYTGFVRFSELDGGSGRGDRAQEPGPPPAAAPLLRPLSPGAVRPPRPHPWGGPVPPAGEVGHPTGGGRPPGPARGGGAPVPADVAAVLRHHRHPGAGKPPVPHDPHAQALLGHDDRVPGGVGQRAAGAGRRASLTRPCPRHSEAPEGPWESVFSAGEYGLPRRACGPPGHDG